MSRSDRVFYQQGRNVQGGEGTHTLVDRVLPYFKRTDVTFCSHLQTPPVEHLDKFPAVLAGERFVYFADPIFREYRQSGNIAARDAWRLGVSRLIGAPSVGEGLPTTMLVYPRRKGADLLLTLLHYVPVRKALDIDVIEERHSFAGECLRFSTSVSEVRVFRGETLTGDGRSNFLLPAIKGRLLLEIPHYFGKQEANAGMS